MSLSGCATDEAAERTAERPGQTDMRVAAFRIEGVEEFDAGQIKSGLATQTSADWRTAISWMPLLGAEPEYFNRIEWRRDLERIENFYRQRGYFNARIVSQNILESQEEGVVRIRLVIDEGEPARVRNLNIEGLSPLDESLRQKVTNDLVLAEDAVFTEERYLRTRSLLVNRLRGRAFAYASINGRAVVDPEENAVDVTYFLDPGPRSRFGEIHIVGNEEIPSEYIRDAIDIREGQPYSNSALQEAQEDIYGLEVFSLVSVLPAHEAREEVVEEADIEPEEIPDQQVTPQNEGAARDQAAQPTEEEAAEARDEIEGIDGQPDTDAPPSTGLSEMLDDVQRKAEARTDLEREVPVVIRLKEGRMWNVELGAGLAIESNRQDIHGQANWSSQNFLGGLRRLEHFNTVGYAWAYNASEVGLGRPFGLGGETEADNDGIFLSSELEFRQPRFIERKTDLRVAPRVDREVEVGYTVWNPRMTVGLERNFFRHLDLGLDYHVSYYDFADLTSTLLTATPLGADFQEEFLLEWLEQRAALDFRDNPLDPRQGTHTELSVQEASSYLLGGEFDYLKVRASTEGYLPFTFLTDWVLAGRMRLGSIYNMESVEGDGGDGQVAQVPALSRLFSGGRGRARSFGHDTVSQFRVGAFDPDSPSEVEEVEVIPVGGLSLFEVSVEPRFRLVENLFDIGDLWGAVYYDGATVLDRQLFFSTEASEFLGQETADSSDLSETLLHGVGGGTYWLTPVGPVRLDVAVTLNDLTDDPRFRTCGPPSRVQDEVTETGRSDCEFLPVDQDPVQQQLNLNYSFYIGIGHSF
ncbi:MAG: BamA/OMP85 family outer membrane protein [Persicimonas sp.]